MKRSSPERKPLDWQQARQRLARAAAAIEEGTRLSPERGRQLLEERARVLARLPERAARAAEVLEVVTFQVAGECYAVGTRHVREVVRFSEVTPVPGAPNYLAGVVNLRGEILAVFEPHAFFGLARKGEAGSSRILVLGGERAEFGMLADAVDEVRALRVEEVLPPSDALAGPGRECLRGVTANGLVVLDGTTLLRDPRLCVELGSSD